MPFWRQMCSEPGLSLRFAPCAASSRCWHWGTEEPSCLACVRIHVLISSWVYVHPLPCLFPRRKIQEAWTNLGSLLRDWGKGEKALGAFDSALSLDTAYVHAYHLRGLCRHGMGDHRGAEADFMRGLCYDGQVCALCALCTYFYWRVVGCCLQVTLLLWPCDQRKHSRLSSCLVCRCRLST